MASRRVLWVICEISGLVKYKGHKMKKTLFLTLLLMLLPMTAWAHPGHGESGFMSGLVHPFSGLDHVIGMLAVGIWAARNSGARRWLVALVFLAGMLLGGIIGMNGQVPVFLESVLAASVLASAVLVALAVRMPVLWQAGFALFFAIWHGIAHGAELPAMAAPFGYASGFLLATALLLAAGVGLGSVLQQGNRDRWLGAGMAVLAVPLFWS